MKAFLGFVLVGAVVAFYFGYSPSDLMHMWPSGGGSNPPPKVRRAAAPAEQTQAAAPAAPVRSSGSSTASTKSADGSLEDRWAPAKP